MSPILTRPIREQLEHDRIIRQLQARYKRKHEVLINPGPEQNHSVMVGDLAVYPDLLLYTMERGRRLEGTNRGRDRRVSEPTRSAGGVGRVQQAQGSVLLVRATAVDRLCAADLHGAATRSPRSGPTTCHWIRCASLRSTVHQTLRNPRPPRAASTTSRHRSRRSHPFGRLPSRRLPPSRPRRPTRPGPKNGQAKASKPVRAAKPAAPAKAGPASRVAKPASRVVKPAKAASKAGAPKRASAAKKRRSISPHGSPELRMPSVRTPAVWAGHGRINAQMNFHRSELRLHGRAVPALDPRPAGLRTHLPAPRRRAR